MMLKVNNDYLEFSGPIQVEVDKKIKLFEAMDATEGDVSFQFDVPETNKNIRLLNYPIPDSVSKSVYQRIDCDLQDDSGVSLYQGFLRIERRNRRDFLALSFFSGNSNWFGLISGNLNDLDFSEFDGDHDEDTITATWNNTTGKVFPLIDNGGLITRSFAQVKVEDFVAGLYVHTVIKKVFQGSSIKLEGELFSDPTYNKAVTIRNSKNNELIDARTSYVEKDTIQAIADATVTKVTWDNDSTYPFGDGSEDNFDLANSQYVADLKMNVEVQCTLVYLGTGTFINMFIFIEVNGVVVKAVGTGAQSGVESPISVNTVIQLEAGDVLEIFFNETDQDTDAGNLIRGTLKITPTYIYKDIGGALVPNWTKQDYVSNIFQLFNVITSFDNKTKTLTCNLFEKLKDKEAIDVSQYVTVEDTDYTEFISNYGKSTTFEYKDIDFDELKEYKIANFFRYGQGVLSVDNDFLQEIQGLITLDFANPFSYLNSVFDMSMERTNLIEISEGEGTEFDDVADDGFGSAAFHIGNEIFAEDDLVRISDSTNNLYNGDWVVASVPTDHIILFGVAFDTAASGKVTKLNFAQANNDDVFILVNIPTYPLTNFSGLNQLLFERIYYTEFGTAYFSLLNTGRQINTDYKQSLSFGAISDPQFYQRTILETYWSLVERVLNDPVKPICTAIMPANVYRSIDFLRPLMIRTLETSNLYYCNLMSGYKSSYETFQLELIKLP